MGGLPPYSINVTNLPPGLGRNGAGISGVPLSSGVWTLNVTVTDSLGQTVSASPSLTVNPAASSYSIKDESKGKITAIGAGYLLVGSKKLIWDKNTIIIVNTPSGAVSVIDSFVKVGMKVQWKGLRDPATSTVLTNKIEIN
jgi:hypothetical protein